MLCVFVGLVLIAAVVVCVVCARVCVWCVGGAVGCLSSPLWAPVGGSVWVQGLCVMVPHLPWLWGLGVVPRQSWLASVGGGVFPRRPLCVPSLLFLLAASPGALFPWCLVRDYPACGGCVVGLGGWGGVFDAGSGPFPWCFPLGKPCTPGQGVTLLYGPSICTPSVQMDLLRTPGTPAVLHTGGRVH